MPRSPFQRAAEQSLNQPDGGSSAGSGKAKRKPKPTSKAKHRKKKIKKRYSAAREEAQLAGVIPTTPDGAVHEERVSPSAQSEDSSITAALVAQAIRNGWEVPKASREQFVDELTKVINNPDETAKAKIAAFNALRLADKDQWERDHPAEAGRAKGGGGSSGPSVNVIQANIDAAALVRRMIESGDLGLIEEVRAPDQSSPPGDSGQQQTMEAGSAPADNQQQAGTGMADT